MTYENVIEMLEEAGLPLAYDHFAEGESPEPPFLIFLLRLTARRSPSVPLPPSLVCTGTSFTGISTRT